MIRSMTGFGRCECSCEEWDLVAEVKTLNHRFLEIGVRLPGVFTQIEVDVRNLVKSLFSRGKVDVYISYVSRGGKSVKLSLNDEVVAEYVSLVREASEKFGLLGQLTVQDLLSLKDAVVVEEDELDVEGMKDLILGCVGDACSKAIEMRENEGRSISRFLKKQLKKLVEVADGIKALADENKKQKVKKMRERVQELVVRELSDGVTVDEGRLMTEVAFLLDRYDVTEEIERIASHIEQFRNALKIRKEAVGRKLDFIIQEINRELNTIGSKCQNSEISSLVVDGKALVEKMREQIQNVE